MVFGGGILGFLMGAGKAVSADEGLIRPPGAEPEEIFLGTCARCGKCAEICPRGCIKIAHGEQGAAIGTPYIVPVENYCDLCMKCVEVCTTGALKPVEKEKVRMGLAQIDKDVCLARKGEDCRVCHAACPFYDKAGCGRCENVCIASPQKAATVKPRQD